jgi:uncharacterized protein (TIGR00369 family)
MKLQSANPQSPNQPSANQESANQQSANQALVREMFERAAFIRSLGIEFVSCGLGSCETSYTKSASGLQQHGYVHAAVLTAMADHSAGAAAGTMVGAEQDVITVEIKVSFLRPAAAERYSCIGKVLRAGKTLIFAEAEIFAVEEGAGAKLVAKLSSTLAVIRHA